MCWSLAGSKYRKFSNQHLKFGQGKYYSYVVYYKFRRQYSNISLTISYIIIFFCKSTEPVSSAAAEFLDTLLLETRNRNYFSSQTANRYYIKQKKYQVSRIFQNRYLANILQIWKYKYRIVGATAVFLDLEIISVCCILSLLWLLFDHSMREYTNSSSTQSPPKFPNLSLIFFPNEESIATQIYLTNLGRKVTKNSMLKRKEHFELIHLYWQQQQYQQADLNYGELLLLSIYLWVDINLFPH